MKTIILPFSCIKAHYEGDIFTPVEVAAGVWELQSATRVLGGSNGNLYHFTSAANAALWVDSNLIRASKQKTTRIQMIAQLQAKHAANPQPWLAEEIAVLEARNAGEWGIVLGEPITGDWEIYPQGVSEDENNALILGSDGKPFYEPAPQGGGVVYSPWFDITARNAGTNVIIHAHGLQIMPDGIQYKARVDVAKFGFSVGDFISPEGFRGFWWGNQGTHWDALNIISTMNTGTNVNATMHQSNYKNSGAQTAWLRNDLTIFARAWASI